LNSSEMRKRLIEEFRDKEYRQIYSDDFLNTSIATQIRVLRESRKLSQKEFAALIGTTQPAISAHESPDKTSWSISTLRKIAAAFDVALVVRFESFGKVLGDIVEFNRESLERPSFEDDPVFQPERPEAPVVTAKQIVAVTSGSFRTVHRRVLSSSWTRTSVPPGLEETYG
jgi:transcriptional regulator with XRE-family HTH domain